MNELLLALAIICQKTNDYGIPHFTSTMSTKLCVADLLECSANQNADPKLYWAKCLREGRRLDEVYN